MKKTFLMTLILTLPVAAQIDSSIPASSMNISEISARPFLPRSEALSQRPELTAMPGRSLYRWSGTTVLAANAADLVSSWGNLESNPVVGAQGPEFGVTAMAIKSGFVAASLVIQHVVLRHRPDLYKKLAWLNFATSGVLGAAATHNVTVR